MKTFKDLEFKQHPSAPYFNTQAEMKFDNGYGVSVITGKGAYSTETQPYEVAILFNDSICYSTSLTDDVLGYQDEDMVTEIMKRVQELPNELDINPNSIEAQGRQPY